MGKTDRHHGRENKAITAEEKKRRTIEKRQECDKDRLLECLRKIPVVMAACHNAGVSRATYYRWVNEDPEFAENVDQAISEGIDLVSDKAESNIIKRINEGDMAASKYWLDNRRKAYKKPRKPQETDEKKIKTLVVDF